MALRLLGVQLLPEWRLTLGRETCTNKLETNLNPSEIIAFSDRTIWHVCQGLTILFRSECVDNFIWDGTLLYRLKSIHVVTAMIIKFSYANTCKSWCELYSENTWVFLFSIIATATAVSLISRPRLDRIYQIRCVLVQWFRAMLHIIRPRRCDMLTS